jgi:hypothetical protein
MEVIRDNFKEHVGYNPEPYDLATRDELGDADLPHHPAEQGKTAEEQYTHDNPGYVHGCFFSPGQA